MKALRLEDKSLFLDPGFPVPKVEGEVLIKVISAGICNTDLEIVKGYGGFEGILGHEFVGTAVGAADTKLVGRRVAGEINSGCNHCQLCKQGDARHCPDRTVLGIKGRDGAFAEFLSLPARNLLEVPDSLTDDEAVFIEPVAAACEILDQVDIGNRSRVCVVGDGKLGQLIVRVLATTGCQLTVIGKHQQKLELAAAVGAKTVTLDGPVGSGLGPGPGSSALATSNLTGAEHSFDVVVEASGSPSGLDLALSLVRPRGIVVLKSTHHDRTSLDLSQVVVSEITLVGSRCGRFERAIQVLATREVKVDDLISDRFRLENWEAAFDRAAESSSLKVIVAM
jgi:threonine dehydrogenase-like Zn-dependent dehydrogenase